jgi:L-glyceraldehyde 3-phosphate reductase
MSEYIAKSSRYDSMEYRRCGESGLKLSALSLGLWHNFGLDAPYANSRELILSAFDNGITHFDLANNYGPPAGAAETTFGKVFNADLKQYRDEIIVSSKAGYDMWPGPYGDWGSRKYLISSLDQSLKRMNLDYVDIFYHHRRDPETPLLETMTALADIVHSGKALYIGISNYNAEDTKKAVAILEELKVPCLINQFSYSMLNQDNKDVIPASIETGMGTIIFSPLSQGLLTGKYNNGIPKDSRVAKNCEHLHSKDITEERIEITRKLNFVAEKRGQKLSQLALSWILSQQGITSVIIGVSKVSQILENIKCLENLVFSPEEIKRIDDIINGIDSCNWW